MGPTAPPLPSDTHALDCATPLKRALCPNSPRATSGIFYTDVCLDYPNPIDDPRWNETASAHLFAYGVPPHCRPCPKGCRCPGGNRCRAEEGYYVPDEDLGDSQKPVSCHSDAAIAKGRCAGYSKSAGGTVCVKGYTGLLCATCGENWCVTGSRSLMLSLSLSLLSLLFSLSLSISLLLSLSLSLSLYLSLARSRLPSIARSLAQYHLLPHTTVQVC